MMRSASILSVGPKEIDRRFTRADLIEALRRVQHFLPPRPTRQDKATLVDAAYAALKSEKYGQQMLSALRDVS